MWIVVKPNTKTASSSSPDALPSLASMFSKMTIGVHFQEEEFDNKVQPNFGNSKGKRQSVITSNPSHVFLPRSGDHTALLATDFRDCRAQTDPVTLASGELVYAIRLPVGM